MRIYQKLLAIILSAMILVSSISYIERKEAKADTNILVIITNVVERAAPTVANASKLSSFLSGAYSVISTGGTIITAVNGTITLLRTLGIIEDPNQEAMASIMSICKDINTSVQNIDKHLDELAEKLDEYAAEAKIQFDDLKYQAYQNTVNQFGNKDETIRNLLTRYGDSVDERLRNWANKDEEKIVDIYFVSKDGKPRLAYFKDKTLNDLPVDPVCDIDGNMIDDSYTLRLEVGDMNIATGLDVIDGIKDYLRANSDTCLSEDGSYWLSSSEKKEEAIGHVCDGLAAYVNTDIANARYEGDTNSFALEVYNAMDNYCSGLLNPSTSPIDAQCNMISLTYNFKGEAKDAIRKIADELILKTACYQTFALSLIKQSSISDSKYMDLVNNFNSVITYIDDKANSLLELNDNYVFALGTDIKQDKVIIHSQVDVEVEEWSNIFADYEAWKGITNNENWSISFADSSSFANGLVCNNMDMLYLYYKSTGLLSAYNNEVDLIKDKTRVLNKEKNDSGLYVDKVGTISNIDNDHYRISWDDGSVDDNDYLRWKVQEMATSYYAKYKEEVPKKDPIDGFGNYLAYTIGYQYKDDTKKIITSFNGSENFSLSSGEIANRRRKICGEDYFEDPSGYYDVYKQFKVNVGMPDLKDEYFCLNDAAVCNTFELDSGKNINNEHVASRAVFGEAHSGWFKDEGAIFISDGDPNHVKVSGWVTDIDHTYVEFNCPFTVLRKTVSTKATTLEANDSGLVVDFSEKGRSLSGLVEATNERLNNYVSTSLCADGLVDDEKLHIITDEICKKADASIKAFEDLNGFELNDIDNDTREKLLELGFKGNVVSNAVRFAYEYNVYPRVSFKDGSDKVEHEVEYLYDVRLKMIFDDAGNEKSIYFNNDDIKDLGLKVKVPVNGLRGNEGVSLNIYDYLYTRNLLKNDRPILLANNDYRYFEMNIADITPFSMNVVSNVVPKTGCK